MGLNVNKIVYALLEKGSDPYIREPVILQYRPFQVGDDWRWFWLLVAPDHSKSIATGEADTRAGASTAARLEARKRGVVIASVELKRPYQDQAATAL